MGEDRAVRNEVGGARVVGALLQAGSVGEIHQHFAAEGPVVVPWQLPPPPAGFVNRVVELGWLDGALGVGRCPVVVLSGLGGVGKTGLGVHWAHLKSHEFPDGQLYVDLGAVRYRGGVDVGDVLGGFLRALGVRDEWIPAEREEKAALYRSLVAGRRMLVMVDNADEPAQVRPLVPASPGSMVLVTSRQRLTGLLVEGARLVALDPLDAAEGVRLLGRMLSDARVDAEAEAAAEIVRQCGGLPIALRVCGARLMTRRRRGIGRLSADLADERRRLAQLSTEGRPVVEAIFDAAYQSLGERAAALYRGLGAHPGPEFSLEAIEAIGDADEVDTLLEASLLEEVGEDRYRFHDLVRLHARARAEPGAQRRIVEWYLRRAQAADWAVLGGRLRLHESPPNTVFADSWQALNWLETERTNLIEAVRAAAREQWDATVWQFTEALWAFYDNRTHHADELEVARLGVEAAHREGNVLAEAKSRNQVVRALLRAGEVPRSEARKALEVAAAGGHRRIESAVIESSGFVELAEGRYDAAVESFTRSRTINLEMANPRGAGLQNLHIGIAQCRAGRHEPAIDALLLGLEIMKEIGDEFSQAKIRLELGENYIALGRNRAAAAVLAEALDVMTDRDLPERQVRALELLAKADPAGAERYREAVRAIRGDV